MHVSFKLCSPFNDALQPPWVEEPGVPHLVVGGDGGHVGRDDDVLGVVAGRAGALESVDLTGGVAHGAVSVPLDVLFDPLLAESKKKRCSSVVYALSMQSLSKNNSCKI